MMRKKPTVNKEKALIISVGDLYICVYTLAGTVMVFWFHGQKPKKIKDLRVYKLSLSVRHAIRAACVVFQCCVNEFMLIV